MSKIYWDKALNKHEKRVAITYIYLLKTKTPEEMKDWLTPHQFDSLQIKPDKLPEWLFKMTPKKLEMEVVKYGGPFKWI
jgi:hypothetical protein